MLLPFSTSVGFSAEHGLGISGELNVVLRLGCSYDENLKGRDSKARQRRH